MSPVAALRERLAALDAAYTPGHHGRWSARRRASFADEALGELWASAGPPAGSALAALGGYGRGELAPRSDLDLLILHGGRDGAVRDLAERLLYPLWDAGFAVGHAVRTVKECLAEASRLDSLTALLDARLLAGDEGPFSELRDRILARVRKEGRAFLERLREEAHRRHERHGSAAHLLEPDLKEGAGGLRDVHSVGWAAIVVIGSSALDGLQLRQ
ncbi:MAG: [protein-PII] uridylyltransferase, partial [Actinobacteria bacterium]|nr:[protein-PII] uridylyltransferase [Actinomycetota bacterium]